MARNSLQVKPASRYEVDVSSARPFVKWVGGKRQLLPVILKNLPDNLGTHIVKYAEPFVGGGALLFELLKNYAFDEIFINDMNIGLIRCYESIRDNLPELSEKLEQIQNNYYGLLTLEEKEKYFYQLRSKYNELLAIEIENTAARDNSNAISFAHHIYSPVNLAAHFIALNKTCFNGMYRVNAKGMYNVPFGKSEEPLICDKNNLHALSYLLSKTIINHGDYKSCESFVDENTFVYFDPPYRPLTNTSAFTAYTKDGFNDSNQIELSEFVYSLSQKGAKVMISNSDPKNADPNDNFFDNAYSWCNILRVGATRMINSKASRRGKVSEIIITNYKKGA